MLAEDTSTKCPECKKPLVWISVLKREEEEELRFSCDACKREFRYADGQLGEVHRERDPKAESAAVVRSEHEAVLNHRCPACGGPISDGRMGPLLTCLWCHERYSVEGGELVPRMEDFLPPPKPRLSDFYPAQRQR